MNTKAIAAVALCATLVAGCAARTMSPSRTSATGVVHEQEGFRLTSPGEGWELRLESPAAVGPWGPVARASRGEARLVVERPSRTRSVADLSAQVLDRNGQATRGGVVDWRGGRARRFAWDDAGAARVDLVFTHAAASWHVWARDPEGQPDALLEAFQLLVGLDQADPVDPPRRSGRGIVQETDRLLDASYGYELALPEGWRFLGRGAHEDARVRGLAQYDSTETLAFVNGLTDRLLEPLAEADGWTTLAVNDGVEILSVRQPHGAFQVDLTGFVLAEADAEHEARERAALEELRAGLRLLSEQERAHRRGPGAMSWRRARTRRVRDGPSVTVASCCSRWGSSGAAPRAATGTSSAGGRRWSRASCSPIS